HLKKRIVTENLFGVDVMEEAVEIARLRLFLALVASARTVDELEPLPNVDFNLLAGNSLVGLLHVDPEEFAAHQKQTHLFRKSLAELLEEKNRLIATYRDATSYGEDLRALRDDIERRLGDARAVLDDVLLARFTKVGVKVEEATWDDAKGAEGKPKKRPVKFADVRALEPFHWGYELDDILDRRGGFDVILTNPPWETWKPQAKEFFAEHSTLVTKNKMSIEDFEKEKEKLLADLEVRAAWLAYQARFPHVSQWFRKAPDYEHQTSEVGGRKTSSDLNLYKLFLERAYRLLRPGGRCGILLPTGVYTDLGAKGLRELLFGETEIDHLFGLSNERYLFDGVDHRFRICVLSFRKGGSTEKFLTAFRINPREAVSIEELDGFLHDRGLHLEISIDVVRRLSPDSLSLLELKCETDLEIVQKMLRFPMLGERIEGTWNLKLGTDLHMTNDSRLFHTEPGGSRLPLFEGKMINQFDAAFAKPKYWVEEADGRNKLLGKVKVEGKQALAYQEYRIGFRDVARDTDIRTMIAAVLPQRLFCNHKLPYVRIESRGEITQKALLFLVSILDSFVFDFLVRFRVSASLTFFIVYQTPAPRPAETDLQIVERAARLTCVSPAYADLWREARGTEWTPADAATDPADRARLRAEIDARVARLYGLNEEELRHVLATFPVVAEEVKEGVLAAWRELSP
ncbi:MAG TPA: ATP-binding protein, partial [Thermoanaerobaculia bacterium]|nr:ATP-binding protein [Thermoanaerobaculia bacterium]